MGLSIRYFIGDKLKTEQEYATLSSNDPEDLDSSKPLRETSTKANNLRFGGHARFKIVLVATIISTGIALAMLFFTFLGWNMCSSRLQNSLLRTPVPSCMS
jgi:hypothetical protein